MIPENWNDDVGSNNSDHTEALSGEASSESDYAVMVDTTCDDKPHTASIKERPRIICEGNLSRCFAVQRPNNANKCFLGVEDILQDKLTEAQYEVHCYCAKRRSEAQGKLCLFCLAAKTERITSKEDNHSIPKSMEMNQNFTDWLFNTLKDLRADEPLPQDVCKSETISGSFSNSLQNSCQRSMGQHPSISIVDTCANQ